MKQRIKEIEHIENLLEFPQKAIEEVQKALSKIESSSKSKNEFLTVIAEYERNKDCDFSALLERMNSISSATGTEIYTGNLVFLLAIASPLFTHYKNFNIDESIFYNTIKDIKYKLVECELVKNVEGIFVPNWFDGFFNLTRFALNRLQFEIRTLNCEHKFKSGFELHGQHDAINIHIPRTGEKLEHNEVLKSYKMAKEFFKDNFKDGPTIFMCSSWLLDTWHKEVLDENSNIYKFICDFEILKTEEYENYSEIWRLFDMDYRGNPDELPSNSTLRRAYIEKIKRGQKTAHALGAFIL